MSVRVFELAADLMLRPSLLLTKIRELGISVENYFSYLYVDDLSVIMREIDSLQELVWENIKDRFEEYDEINALPEHMARNFIISLFHQGRYGEALPYIERALKLNSNDAELWNDKGVALNNIAFSAGDLTKFEEAIEYYEISLAIDPETLFAWFNKGLAHASLGEYEVAINNYMNAIKIDPNIAEIWRNLGLCYGFLENFEKAIDCFTKTIELDPENYSAIEQRRLLLQFLEDEKQKANKD